MEERRKFGRVISQGLTEIIIPTVWATMSVIEVGGAVECYQKGNYFGAAFFTAAAVATGLLSRDSYRIHQELYRK